MGKSMIDLITSEDWKERVQGEYLFIKDKTERLGDMLEKYSNHALDFKPNCSFELLTMQYNAMINYLNILELRMNIEYIKNPQE